MLIIMKNDLESRLISFSVTIINFSDNLVNRDASKVLKNQILRSATSSALNYGEAQNAQSKRDFISKVSIVLKELRETNVNLRIINEARLFRERAQMEDLLRESYELVAIFISIVKKAKSTQTS